MVSALCWCAQCYQPVFLRGIENFLNALSRVKLQKAGGVLRITPEMVLFSDSAFTSPCWRYSGRCGGTVGQEHMDNLIHNYVLLNCTGSL